ncbi:endolytic transglycosylase MltG [Acidithiobacillus sp. AMEEHan]|uniref:endolytic transglycosylase MltG n=1 Tax=Acidithiobacillus sp. AMEEHan TaxID=2994951 RepID=UPI0027E52BB8|nr:endolytic transglycosylase MltG [Acidithiobacillus sp. AMEEHan]
MRSWLLRLTLLLLGAIAALLGWALWDLYRPIVLPAQGTEVPIRLGASVDASIQELHNMGLLPSPILFRLLWQVDGRPPLHAGLYVFRGRVSMAEVLETLRAGRSQPLDFTIVPGMTLAQVLQQLQHAPYLGPKGIPTAGQLPRLLGPMAAARENAEGCLLPQSYRYVPGEAPVMLLRQAAQAMQQTLQKLWMQRAPKLPLNSPYEALILASIVQREGAPLAQQKRIAAVFINRLRIGMPLQSDPTVIYALGKAYDGHLQPAQMQVQSPYNTYLHSGLPPGPIAMPSQQALEAVLHPAAGDDLYFIAKGNEYHYSAGFAEHQRQIQRYLQAGIKNG